MRGRHETTRQGNRRRGYMNEVERLDYSIIVTVIILCVYGLIMVTSASYYMCSMTREYNYDPIYLMKRQLIFTLFGFFVMLVIQHWNYRWLKKLSVLIYIGAIGSIFLLLTSLGVESHNAVRWINIGGISIQVAEIVKIALIIALAALASRFGRKVRNYKVIAIFWIVGLFPALLIYKISNNLSSAIILLGITFGITFILSTRRWLHFGLAGGGLALATAYVIHVAKSLPTAEELSTVSFRIGRIAAWIAPERYASGQAYQSLQALYAVGRGGILGKGLGNSLQKLYNIPEPQNDMMFAVICEELGIFGACITLLLFGYLIYLLMKVAINCKNMFGATLVCGVVLHISLQVAINVSVVVGIFPNTGVSLPFISYGGSAILFTLIEIGIVLSVYRRFAKDLMKRRSKRDEEENMTSEYRRQQTGESRFR